MGAFKHFLGTCWEHYATPTATAAAAAATIATATAAALHSLCELGP